MIKNLFLALCVIVCLAACSNNDYKNFIPKNADFVAEVEPEQIFKSFTEFFDYNQNLLSGQMSDIMKYFNGTEPIGIDWDSPVCFFHAPNGEDEFGTIGFTMNVQNKEQIMEFFTELNKLYLCETPYEEDGSYWVWLNGIYLTFNDNLLAMAVKNTKTDKREAMQMITKYLDQNEDKSFVSTDDFKSMDEQPGNVKMYCNVKKLCAPIDDRYFNRTVAEINSYLPAPADVTDFKVFANVIFKEGLCEANVKIDTDNNANKELLDAVDQGLKKLEGNCIGTDDNFLFWAAAGLNGDNLIQGLDNFGEIRRLITTYLDTVVNGRETIKALNGDCSLLVTMNEKEPLFQLMAKIDNDKFMNDDDNIIDLIKKETNNRVNDVPGSGTMYEVNDHGYVFQLGTHNDYFCLANSSNGESVMKDYQNNKLMAVKNEITKSVVYAYVNHEEIKKMVMKEGVPFLNRLVDYFDYYTVSMKDVRNVKLRIVMRDKNTPFLQQVGLMLNDFVAIGNTKTSYDYDDYE